MKNAYLTFTTLACLACAASLAACGKAPSPTSSTSASEPADKPANPPPAQATPPASPLPAPGDMPAAAQPGAGPGAGGLTWKAPEPLTARQPKSRMRAAEYAVSGAAGEAELTVYYFGPGQGGGVQANLDRWIGQIAQPDGSDSKEAAKIAERKVGDLKVTTLDVAGTFNGGMAPMMQKQAPEPQTAYRMLGAIAEGPQGPVFFKLVGPTVTVGEAESAFLQLVESLKPAG